MSDATLALGDTVPTVEGMTAPVLPRFDGLRLERKLGEGGMGEVWLAEQLEPVQRQVAVKVIKAGMDSKEIVARFESERQALALMDHPAIAKVFDGGTTPEGRPFFVMEYVAGLPITEYCDTNRLSTSERLELLAEVCEGVQHAHHKAVIHRDLKPSNILVTRLDGRAQPKIIDFGIAKAVGRRLTDKTLFTELGMVIGTPEYMSPEQADSTGADVDTRTDVYSLGVVLYQLLTGELPFSSDELRASAEALRRKLRDEDPPRPSTRLSKRDERAAEAARARNTDPGSLCRQLQGDLDAITLRTLEKERARRYGTPSELAADIRRHLRHEPVVARPASAAYRVSKYVRRHRLGVALVTVAAIALVGGAGLALWQAGVAGRQARIANEQARVARIEQSRSQAIQAFLLDLFRANTDNQADPLKAREMTARQLLDVGAERAREKLKDSPEVQDQVLDTLSDMYRAVGLDVQSAEMARERVALRRRLYGERDARVAEALFDYAAAIRKTEDEKLAAGLLSEAQAIVEAAPTAPPDLRVILLTELARETLYTDATATRERARQARALIDSTGGSPPDRQSTFFYEGLATEWMGDCQAAVPIYEEALREARTPGTGRLSTQVAVLIQLGSAAWCLADLPRAERYLREALELSTRLNGERHLDTFHVETRLARLLHESSRREEAWRLHDAMMAKVSEVKGAQTPHLVRRIELNWMANLLDEGQIDAAARMQKQAAQRDQRQGTRGLLLANALLGRARMQVAQGRYEEALAVLAEAEKVRSDALGPGALPRALDSIRVDRAAAQLARGDAAATLETLGTVSTAAPPGALLPLVGLRAEILRAAAHLQLGDPAEARANASAALESLRQSSLRPYFRTLEADALLALGAAQCRQGDVLAEETLRSGLELRRAEQHPESPWLAEAEVALGSCLMDLGRRAEALALAGRARLALAAHETVGAHFQRPLAALQARLAAPRPERHATTRRTAPAAVGGNPGERTRPGQAESPQR
ncbi:MAG TPA: serine/threonine-protein kinase [Myxococcaceae bacterium]|nr:serine/threonine-protein kinase [Myxococcaceae bacterium]